MGDPIIEIADAFEGDQGVVVVELSSAPDKEWLNTFSEFWATPGDSGGHRGVATVDTCELVAVKGGELVFRPRAEDLETYEDSVEPAIERAVSEANRRTGRA